MNRVSQEAKEIIKQSKGTTFSDIIKDLNKDKDRDICIIEDYER